MSFVGLDPQAALDLVARFDRAVQDLERHAQTVESLFAQAGHPGESGAAGTMRHVAAWAAYRRRDLQKRIDKVLIADSGSAGATPSGFRFGSQADAEKAGRDEAKKIKELLDAGKYEALEAELARVKQYANDPSFAAAFLKNLGSKELTKLTKKVLDKDHDHAQDDLAGVARMLAVLTNAKGLPEDVRKTLADDKKALFKPDMVDALATLLSVGGFSSQFTADAARAILITNRPLKDFVGSSAAGVHMDDSARQVALLALAHDPKAAFLFAMPGGKPDDTAIKVLLDPNSVIPVYGVPDDEALDAAAAKALQALLVDYRTVDGDATDAALIAVVHDVAHGASVSDAGKRAVAAGLREPIVDGRLGAMLTGHSPLNGMHPLNVDHVSPTDWRDAVSVLMGDKTATGMLLTDARDFTLRVLKTDVSIVNPRDSAHVSELGVPTNDLGATFGLLDSALAKHLHTEASHVSLEVAVIHKLADGAKDVGLAATPLTGPEAATIGFGIGMGLDAGANAFKDHEIDSIYKDAGPSQQDTLDTNLRVALAQAAWDDPRIQPTLSDPGSLAVKGQFVYPKNGDRTLEDWLIKNDLANYEIALRNNINAQIAVTEKTTLQDKVSS